MELYQLTNNAMKQVSLGELAIQLGVNKSKLAYYFSLGLLKPVAQIGRMNVFDQVSTVKIIKKIEAGQKNGKTLEVIKNMK